MKRMWSKNELLRLSDAEIRSLIESGEIDNAKPIYCHPISMYDAANTSRLGCLIFNNDPTPFTLESFLSFIDDLYEEVGDTIRIITTGSYLKDTNVCIACYLGKGAVGYYYGGSNVSDGVWNSVTGLSKEDMQTMFTSFSDGVNKIN